MKGLQKMLAIGALGLALAGSGCDEHSPATNTAEAVPAAATQPSDREYTLKGKVVLIDIHRDYATLILRDTNKTDRVLQINNYNKDDCIKSVSGRSAVALIKEGDYVECSRRDFGGILLNNYGPRTFTVSADDFLRYARIEEIKTNSP